MKISSISGLVYAVPDLDETAEFSERLGFRPGRRDDGELTCYVNRFWVTFTTDRGDAGIAPGAAATLYPKVDDIDDVHGALLANGALLVKGAVPANRFTPSGEPHKTRAGRREFLVLDPDGHRLAFFGK